MIDIVCDLNPLTVGKVRKVTVTGNAPFAVKVGNFVTDPAPLGLHDHSSFSVGQGETFEIVADEEFWKERKGVLQVDITDAVSAKRRIHFNVQPAPRRLPSGIVPA